MRRTLTETPLKPQAKPQMALSPLAAYEAAIAQGLVKTDAGQQLAMQQFETLYKALVAAPGKRSWLGKWAPVSSIAQAGLYVWGDVGRGKSMLMDMFVRSITPHCPTTRIHFHAFMLDVHHRLHALRQLNSTTDVLPALVNALSEETRVLCLDELQVTDVTDAMILARLFTGLLDAGVTVVFTSNRPPDELYQGGLQRDQFLKFVELIKARLGIVAVQSPHDYRLAQMRGLKHTYRYPRDSEADDFLLESWGMLTNHASSEPITIEVQGRSLRVDKHYRGIAWLTFGELCVRPLGAADYLALARVCHTLLLQGIPALTPESRNEARRFVTLIDALYDHRVKLIATAATAPDAIYAQGDGTFEFARTVSRLIEMQSEPYWSLPHIA